MEKFICLEAAKDNWDVLFLKYYFRSDLVIMELFGD